MDHMDFDYSPKVKALISKLERFMEENVYPGEKLFEEQLNAQETRWAAVPPIMEELKAKAKQEGLWNLFLPDREYGAGLSNLEYAPLCEIMGRSLLPPKYSTATRPIPGIWKCLPGTGVMSRRKNG